MRIVAITGPRQTGKTTIALQALTLLLKSGYECRYYAIDAPVRAPFPSAGPAVDVDIVPIGVTPDVPWLIRVWEHARLTAKTTARGLVLILDEIQRIHRWSDTVKGLWDADRRSSCPLHVVILGSAPWEMMTGVNESLVGRFNAVHVPH